MARIITFPETSFRIPAPSTGSEVKRRVSPPPEWLLCAGALSLFGGVLAGLTGSLLLALSLLPAAHSLRDPGSVLLIALLPALLLGGLALDRYEARARLHGR
jgi:hypothetical protein